MRNRGLIFSLFLTLAFLFIIFACSQRQQKAEDNIKIYTTIYAFEQFSRWIIPDAQIHVLIPEGADPHHFEPSLKDIQKLYTATMIIYIGDTDIDRWIDRIKRELAEKGVKVVRIQDHIPLRKYSASNEFDPHLWLDPVFATEIIKIIKNAVQEIAPEKKDIYEKNFLDYESKLRDLDRAYRHGLSACSKRNVITTHEFLNYTGARYGFNSYFIVHEPAEEPSVRRMKKLKDFIKENSIKFIISEQEGQNIAMALSEETGAKILPFNTFHTKSQKDYLKEMQDNLKILREALDCR
uniref:Zinc transport system substrate-binding protein n=1 Tax=Thermodesulfovibrio aggregans TaxID=86166 RepID=A0A7C4EKQ2_9BACT